MPPTLTSAARASSLGVTASTDPATASPPMEWLPWHAGARARLETALAGGRLPHGLLLHGPDGVGKEHFATVLAAGLHCSQRGSGLTPCGQCADCSLSRAASHPDLHWLRRPEDRKSIGVDAVRELGEQLGMTSMRSGHRVAIITPAHLMTHSAQNALLKTLEEPAEQRYLLLLSSRPQRLPATIRSRCQRLELALPERGVALDWLRARGHAEGSAASALAIAGGHPVLADAWLAQKVVERDKP